MNTFLSDDFLLHSQVAIELYHDYAKPQPIYDYHSHLPVADISSNRIFQNLYEAWLEGDHYKWRAMRWNGVEEKYCTGDATPWEKFLAFARTVPKTLRNPLYHWTHLELRFYFGIKDLLNEESAASIWSRANEQLASMPVHEFLKKSRVVVACTTDDPVSPLGEHRKISEEGILPTRVYPTFRPDKALAVDQPKLFNDWIDQLSAISGVECSDFQGFLAALKQRHDVFHEVGCRLSDHGLAACYSEPCTEEEAGRIYQQTQSGIKVTSGEVTKFRSYLMIYFAQLDVSRGWTKQLHLGAQRNNNTRAMRALGSDTGFDSISDAPQAQGLACYLDALDREHLLPKMVLYNLNPTNNYLFATMAGNFQDASIPGKIQLGSGWWFLDQKEGIEWQINTLSNLGLLSRFVGMLSDSRSFLSFSRHEYFRRILCNIIGRDVVNGELPSDMKLLGGMVEDICFHNANRYFALEIA